MFRGIEDIPTGGIAFFTWMVVEKHTCSILGELRGESDIFRGRHSALGGVINDAYHYIVVVPDLAYYSLAISTNYI